MNPEVWGPKFWFVLHTIAMAYPMHPNSVSKKKYYEFIQNLPLFIPNARMGNYFAKLLDDCPLTPYLSSRTSFMKWVHFIHNKMNLYLGKSEISFAESLEHYYKHYEPKDITKKQKIKERKRYIEIGIIIVFGVVVLYSAKK